MAVKLRLMRMGKKKQPTYRVVAADARSPRDGRFIEIIGTYEPRQEPSLIKIDNDRAVHWLQHGAQPTERVEKILKVSGAWDNFKGLPGGTSVTEAPAPKPVVQQKPAAPAPAAEQESAPADGAPAEAVTAEAPAQEAPAEEAEAETPVEEAAASEDGGDS